MLVHLPGSSYFEGIAQTMFFFRESVKKIPLASVLYISVACSSKKIYIYLNKRFLVLFRWNALVNKHFLLLKRLPGYLLLPAGTSVNISERSYSLIWWKSHSMLVHLFIGLFIYLFIFTKWHHLKPQHIL